MKNPYNIILKPIITEKATTQKDESNKVSFEVAMQANKKEIKYSVEKLFDVHVEKVQTMRMRGKTKRMGRFVGQRSNWKKAIVTLRQGDKIEYFEGV